MQIYYVFPTFYFILMTLSENVSATVTVGQPYFRKMCSLDTMWSCISFYFVFCNRLLIQMFSSSTFSLPPQSKRPSNIVIITPVIIIRKLAAL